MARGHNPADRRATGEGERDAEVTDAEATDTKEREDNSHPLPELRWVQIRRPRGTEEIGRNGRILASHYHPRYDAWEVLLETYEGELSE